MQRIESELSPKEYAAQMRCRIRLLPAWEGDCFSGIVIGRFFSVAYRTYYDWERRTSYACARAMGFVRQKDDKTIVSYFTARGLFSAFWFVLIALVFLLPAIFDGSDDFRLPLLISVLISFATCASSAFFESMTENGDEAARTIQRFVDQPNTFVGHEKNH